MQSIHANLTAAQLKFPHQPVVKATLVDTPVLRPEQLHTGFTSATDFDGVLASGAIVQAKCGPAVGYELSIQRITTPATESQWTTWSVFDPAKCRAVVMFMAGSYVVIVYWRDAGATWYLDWRRSANSGVSWTSRTSIFSAGAGDAAWMVIAGVGGAGYRGLFYFNPTTRTINYRYYNATTDSWGPVQASSFTIPAAYNVLSLAATYDTSSTKHLCFLSYQDTTAGNNKLQMFTLNPATYAWTDPEDVFSIASPTSYFHHLALSQDQIDGRWWLTMMRWNANTARLVYLLAAVYVSDGQYRVSGAIELERDTYDAGRFLVYPAPSPPVQGWGVILASLRQAKQSLPSQTYFSNRTVLSYRWEATAGRLRCTLDNRDLAITEPPFLASFTISRGLNVAGTEYVVDLPTFYVASFAFTDYDQRVEIEGVDALGLLGIWTATDSQRWAGKTVKELIRLVCARAKVFDVTFDASADWNQVVTEFTLHNGRTALFGLYALLGRVGKARVIARGAGVHCFVLADTVNHTYTRQQFWSGRFGRSLLSNYAMVAGSADSAVGDYAGEEGDTGFRVADLIIDSQVVTVAGAESLAQSVVAYSQEKEQGSAQLVAPVNFALEPGDVIDINDAGLWAGARNWRVVSLVEEYRTGEQPFSQIVGLRAV